MLRDSEERFSPHQTGDIALDHLTRYAAAATMVHDNDEVLDVASGEGYGSALLAVKSRRVTGVDINADCVQHATERYTTPNLRYLQANAESLPLPDGFFDVVVSFETIEHCVNPMAALAEMKRVLKPRGFLVISTPDKVEFNRDRHGVNPFHAHEFTRDEFEAALANRFKHVRMLGQTTKRYSLLTGADGNPTTTFSVGHREGLDMWLSTVIATPMYLIGVASDAGLPATPSLVFG
jgi:ubiquinone/menaquinone biosynthesis C-methylase UbiE